MNRKNWRMPRSSLRRIQGSTLIEVLVSILIMTFGILGLAGLQARAQTAELESYQREQALILMADMTSRMANNKSDSVSYVTTAPLGTGATDATTCSAQATRAAIDQCEWSKMLKGVSEAKGSTNLGAMIDARGCITSTVAGSEYLVAVVWQGINKTVAPAVACGDGLYDSNETRRAVTAIVRVADLLAP